MTTSKPTTARDVAELFLECAADPVGRNLADLYADKIVLEMPFALPNYPKSTETGRDEMRRRFEAGSSSRKYEKVDSTRIHETTDPEQVIVEYALHGTSLATGDSFTVNYVMVITVREGLIVHSRDYTDPIAGMIALGAIPQLIDSLSERISGK